MPRSTIGGDDPEHDLPRDEKRKREKAYREEGVRLLREGKAKESKERVNRALSISRPPSKKAQHH